MSFSFDLKQPLICVRARLSGPAGDRMVRIALDTGASVTMISRTVIERLGYDPEAAPSHAEVTTASGIAKAPVIQIAEIHALGVTRRNVNVICYTLPAGARVDGVLGLDFFRGRRLVIDFREGTVSLE